MEPASQNKEQEGIRERLDVPSQTSIERKLLVRNEAQIAKPSISQPKRNGDLLSRLQAFLPQMEEANKNLDVDETAAGARFEDPEEDEGPVVELDLACGVFDLKDDTAIAAAERSLINQDVVVETFSGGSSDGSSSSSSDESENNSSGDEGNPSHNGEDEAGPSKIDAKKEKRRKKQQPRHPGIEEIS